MPDYTIGIAERIASLPDSFATSNSVNRNYFQATNQSVINKVTVALAPDAPTSLDPTPQTTTITSTDEDSIDTFGLQEGPLFITLLATTEEGGALSQYLMRTSPAYWFSNLAISLNTLSDANKNVVANLEIGQQIAVTKTFPAGVVPQTVTEYLFVEGISHNITVESHVVTIYTGPASTYLQWVLGNYTTTETRVNLVPNPNFQVDVSMTEITSPGGSSLARSTAQAYLGSASCAGSTAGTGGNLIFGTMASSSRVAATAGITYTGSLYVKSAAVQRTAYARLIFYNAGGTTLSTTNGTSANTSTTAWSRYTVTATAPVNTATVLLQIVILSTGTTETHYIDALLLEASASALSYFDGTYVDPYTGYTLTYQAWDGTANTSTSTTVWGLNSSGTGSALGDTTYGLA
jgi:hypothetical protein